MLIETLSVFPDMFEPAMSTSILGRARAAGIFDFRAYDLRDWTHDRHRTVDDEPYGGGQGMLMKAPPIFEAVRAIAGTGPVPHVVFFTPCGAPFTQATAERLAREERILFVCGRYEGIDERAYELADERLSIGDYVLTGGELPAMVVTDAIVRLLPGALGDALSSVDESFATGAGGGLLEYAQYTRPAEFEGRGVPDVLLSGDHANVDAWRRADAIERTCRWRPDLIATADLADDERARARELIARYHGACAPAPHPACEPAPPHRDLVACDSD
ncbi:MULTISPECIES: tRNA (guanosine(37)-N1)-methyltransferase TrmD [Enorma]|uniref:tRNA (guanine-N(1)-)-methyltransferase n=1 Tax=[Collinsella] massiliensis TaxID=1232426 RepID=A0A1Y3XUV5_9ACTN|nr:MULTISPECIES: tRNA (guanosine(37)-N1)-methyltransferase TrmD [Enorma]OUN88911.1 tRNA (guanosine(37)-N1)-methyltransferase TrmD [[Collinsella] massiliensis]